MDCPAQVTYEKKLDIAKDGKSIEVSVICYQPTIDEDGDQDIPIIHQYQRTITLDRPIDPKKSKVDTESETSFHFTLRKADAPSYWPKIISIEGVPEPSQQDIIDSNIAEWRDMTRKYKAQLDDYVDEALRQDSGETQQEDASSGSSNDEL